MIRPEPEFLRHFDIGALKHAFIVFLAIIVACLFSSSVRASDDSFSDTLYQLSGLSVQIQQIPGAIGMGFDQSADSHQNHNDTLSGDSSEIKTGVVEAFDPQALKISVIDSLDRSRVGEFRQQILEWHATDLAKKITALESQRSNLTSADEKLAFQDSLYTEPTDPLRLEELAGLRDAWNLTQSSVDMMVDMQIAVSIGMFSPGPDANETLKYIQKQYNAQRAELSRHYASETLVSMQYIYDELSVEEINKYRSFLESATGKIYVNAINESLHRAMIKGSLNLGAKLATLSRDSLAESL